MRYMSVCLAIPEDRMKVIFSLPVLKLMIILTESRSVFDIVTKSDQVNNDEKHPEISDDTNALGKAIEDDTFVTHQELRNISIANKRNQIKRRKLKRKFKSRKQKRKQENIFIHLSYLTKLS